MKIKIKDNNKIINSNIGSGNIIEKSTEENNFTKYLCEIIVGIIVAVVGGYLLYKLNIN